ncbi:MAG: hypothetical protein J7647_02710 [Cyanobacteria bacterium SBLK]|nr:hypothetical protein [Cyanobacteria bacterium SBLK]
MSKKKGKDNEKNYDSIRQKFYKFLREQEIIIELCDFSNGCNDLNEPIEIEEKKNRNKNKKNTTKLQKVIIADRNCILDSQPDIERIWRIELEKEIKGLEGFKTEAKTTEIALLILKKRRTKEGTRKYTLYIILIELKTTLTIKESLESRSRKIKDKAGDLGSIANKFRCSMNRMYMLLTLNDHRNSNQGFQKDDIDIEFKGLIFYNTDSIDESKIEENSYDRQMYKILKQEDNLLRFQTLLYPEDKIAIEFIKNQDSKPKSMSIEFQEILEKLNIIKRKNEDESTHQD